MQTDENFFKDARKDIEDYFQNNILLLKFQAVEKISKLVAVITAGLLIALFCSFIMLVLTLLAGYYFTDITGSRYIGFGIIAAFYTVVTILIVVFRKQIVHKFITNTVINIFFESNKKGIEDES